MCKECKENKKPTNGNKMSYNCFEELTDDLKNKFQSKAKRTNLDASKKAYVNFINKLNENGDKLISSYVNANTKVRIHYGKCTHEHPEGEGVRPSSYKRGCNCPYCANQKVLRGYNDIATTRPQYIKYFVNIEDTYTHTYASGAKVAMKCPICGARKVMRIRDLVYQGFGCTKCGDGISYSEKLMALVLEKLGIEFTRQLTYNNGKQRYDFYIALWKAIYETHGIQHYEGWCGDKEDLLWQEANDENKRYNATHYLGIRNEDYHEVDCRYSTLEWCRLNIEKALSKYIDTSILTDEDWKEFDRQAQKSLKIEVCLYWKEQKEVNKDLTTTIMAEIFKVSQSVVKKWLNWGNESSLCTYNGEEESKNSKRRQSKFVYLIKPNGTKWYKEAKSQRELARLTGISVNTISLRRKDGKPINGNSKYKGCYIIEAK